MESVIMVYGNYIKLNLANNSLKEWKCNLDKSKGTNRLTHFKFIEAELQN